LTVTPPELDGRMNHQLHLLPRNHQANWHLDAKTKAVGRQGLAQARAALLAARTAPERPPQVNRPASHSHLVAQQRRSAA
jgi:hypothetical protein